MARLPIASWIGNAAAVLVWGWRGCWGSTPWTAVAPHGTDALQGFDALEQAVVDGGSGLRRGLADFQSQRRIAGNSTPLEVSLDVFHTKQEAQRVLRKLWNGVESS